MNMITISAKTLDEAITKALLELQTTSEHLHYEIIQKEKSGFLGFGAKPCIIRAKVMTESEEKEARKAEAEKAAAQKAAEKKAASEKSEEKKTSSETEKAEAERPAVQEPEAKAPETSKSVKAETGTAVTEEEKASEKKSFERRSFSDRKGYDRRRPERRENSRGERSGRRTDFRKEYTEEPRIIREEKPRQPVKADPEKVQSAAKDFLVSVFGAMGMEVSIATELNLEEGELRIMMEGTDMGILIGKRGQTLDSLQYLVSLVVNRETEGYLRVKLDTENYRERRKETLETLARNIAYKVKRTRRPVSLEPMNPYERRIIHSALQNDRYVITRSEGEDPYRHVVISMKNDRYGSGGRRERYPRRDARRSYESPVMSENTAPSETAAPVEVNEPQTVEPVKNPEE